MSPSYKRFFWANSFATMHTRAPLAYSSSVISRPRTLATFRRWKLSMFGSLMGSTGWTSCFISRSLIRPFQRSRELSSKSEVTSIKPEEPSLSENTLSTGFPCLSTRDVPGVP